MIVSLVVTGMLFAGGVALAANIQCQPTPEGEDRAPCLGTPQNDRILGSEGDDEIRARQGDDFVSGFDGSDQITGGTGADRLNGNTGSDFILASAISGGEDPEDEDSIRFVDNSDDVIRGGAQNDVLFGGFGQGGRDQVFGDGGDDFIFVSQRAFRAEGAETRITRETVDCGPGDDQVIFDRGIDVINRENCEELFPVDPGGSPAPLNARSAASLPEFPF